MPAMGLSELARIARRQAASMPMPVLALGGVNLVNTRECVEGGAAGVAGIRLFQQGDVEETVTRLRMLENDATQRSRDTEKKF